MQRDKSQASFSTSIVWNLNKQYIYTFIKYTKIKKEIIVSLPHLSLNILYHRILLLSRNQM